MLKPILTAIIAAVSLCACTYEVKTTASPALNVYSSYTDKLPGSYALFVQPEPNFHECSAFDFPIDARATFKQSATETMKQLVEKLDPVEQPLTAEQLQAGNYRGQIIIKAEEYSPRITFASGFWAGTATSTVDITASLLVDGPAGRLLGTKASESRTADAEAVGCQVGTDVLAKANGKATAAVLDRLAERLSNEPRLRANAAALP